MKILLAAAVVLFSTPAFATDMMITVNVNRVCAAIVDIPYASDNFTDKQWQDFKDCVEFLRYFDGVE